MNNKFENNKSEVPPTKSNETEQHDISQFPIEKSMRNLLREGKYLNQDAVYSTLFQELPEEEIIDKIQQDYGREKSQQMIQLVESELGHEYVRLLIEPSMGCRLDQFIAFSSQLDSSNDLPVPLELREQFKKSLGKTKVFRVVAATDNDIQSISQQGFIANFYRKKTPESLLKNQDFYESQEYNITDLQGRVNVHAGGFATTKDSTLISVSKYPEMAEYAAFVQLKDKWEEMKKQGYKLYSMPIEIDEFDCIQYGKYLPHHINGKGVWTDGETTIDYEDPGIESFVEFQISPDKIKLNTMKEIDVDNISQFKFVSDDDKEIARLREKLKK